MVVSSPGRSLPGPLIIKVTVAAVLLAYPIAIYFASGHLTPSQLFAGLLVLLAARLLVATWVGGVHPVLNPVLAGMLALAAAATLLWLQGLPMDWLRFYPMILDLLIFGVFFGSLFSSRPLVERFARMFDNNLPPYAVRYTRKVTWAWSGLLLAMALISLYTTVATSLRVWSLFNGLIVYVVFGAAFAVEYLVRTHVRRKGEARA